MLIIPVKGVGFFSSLQSRKRAGMRNWKTKDTVTVSI